MSARLTMDQVLRKTSNGRNEQQQRSRQLTARHRHVLILCDGRRALHELCGLMGDTALACAHDLLAMGMIEPVPAGPGQRAPTRTDPANGPEPETAASAVPASQLAAAVAPPSKRSVALARMYMFDMVERLLGPHSGPARAHLRAADRPEALLSALQECLGLIDELAGSDQAGKVQRQLCTMLPEELLDTFQRGGHADFALSA